MAQRLGCARLAAAAVSAVGVVLATMTPASAAAPWWVPVGLRGTALRSVTASGATIEVTTTAGAVLRSTDKGTHFARAMASPPQVAVTSGKYTWSISAAGEVLRQSGTSAAARDPGSPSLGPGARLLAAPAALPGTVVAVAVDGVVWRRAEDGDWKQALLLLPRSMVQGVPPVTALTAFTQPLSDSIYLGTAGYAVLVSTDGGDDWIRAGPGLPDTVNGLAADSGTRSVYAATADGLWVHQLQTLPAPPRYSDRALLARQLGIGAVTVVASLLAVLALARLVPRMRG